MPELNLLENPEEQTDAAPLQSEEGLSNAPGKVIDLNVHLSEEDREALARRVHYDITQYLALTATRRGNLQQWRRDWELFATGRSSRWPGAADVPAPLTHIYVSNHHTRLNQQIVKAVPPFTAVAKTPRALEVANDIEEAMTSRLEDADWEQVADEIHLELPLAGNVGLRVTYEQQVNHVPKHKWDIDEDAYTAMLAAGVPASEALWQSFERDEHGNLKAYFEHDDEDGYSGVVFEVIPWEDMVILPCTVRDPKKAYGIGERVNIRGSDLRQGAEDGKYLKEPVEEILKRRPGNMPDDRTERLDVQGISNTTGSNTGSYFDADYEDYLCYEICWQMDANKDGKMEWVILTLHWDSK